MKRTNTLAVVTVSIILVFMIVLLCLQQRDRLSEDEFLSGLSVRASTDETDLIVEVSCNIRRPDLWHVYRAYAHIGEERRLLGKSVSRLGLASVVRRVPLDDLRGIDRSKIRVELEYAVYRGQSDDGALDPGPPDDDQLGSENLLFSGTVGIETDRRQQSPDDGSNESLHQTTAQLVPLDVFFVRRPVRRCYPSLDETAIADASLEHLKSFSKLSSLCLSDTKITDDGCEHLGEMSGLLNSANRRYANHGYRHGALGRIDRTAIA